MSQDACISFHNVKRLPVVRIAKIQSKVGLCNTESGLSFAIAYNFILVLLLQLFKPSVFLQYQHHLFSSSANAMYLAAMSALRAVIVFSSPPGSVQTPRMLFPWWRSHSALSGSARYVPLPWRLMHPAVHVGVRVLSSCS